MKELKIILNKNTIRLELAENQKIISSGEFAHDENLSENLLAEIDKIIADCKIGIIEVDDFSYVTDQPDSYTSTRIVQAVVNTFNWAKKFRCQPPNCG